MVMTYGGGPPAVAAYEGFGARACHPIYNALDPETHHPVAPDPRFAADLAFLGNRLPDREARVEAFFLRGRTTAARAPLPDRRPRLGRQADAGQRARASAMSTRPTTTPSTATPLAVLNVARDSMAEIGFSPATRVFEAAGAGACLITDAWEGIELFLEPGREVLVARDGADVAELSRHAGRPRPRARIGEAARARILAEHTYDRRGAEVRRDPA